MEVTSLGEDTISSSVTWIIDFVEADKWNKATIFAVYIRRGEF